MRWHHLLAVVVAAGVIASSCSDEAKPTTADFCGEVAAYQQIADQLFNADDPDTATVKATIESADDQLTRLQDTAPAVIAKDVQVLVSTFRLLITSLRGVDYDLAAARQDPAFQSVVDQLSSPDMQTATENLQEFTSTACAPTPSAP